MTKRSTRRVVPLAIACAWLACAASPAGAAPAPAGAAQASAPVAQSAAAAPAATQYTVKPGQSLADIAAEVTQSHDKTVLGRAARSIFEANPSAFMRNDPSLLKLGAVLHIPALDATGAVAQVEPAAAPAPGSAPNAASAGTAASQAAAGTKPGGAPVSKSLSASAPAAAVSPAPASAAAGASASAKAAAPAAGNASNPVAAAHPQPNGAAGGHAWSGAIEPAPVAPSSATAPAPTSAAAASGAAAVSGVAAASTPAVAESSAPASSAAVATGAASASGAMSASGSLPVMPSTPKPAAATAPVVASAIGASHPKVSSLQQLLTLKNRVLMELQRHGFGGASPGHPGTAASAPASASAFAVAPASGAAVAPAPDNSRAASAANQRFIGVGGYGISLERSAIPAVAAVVAAIVAALLVVLVALGVTRRHRRAEPAAGARSGASGAASPLAGDESARASAVHVATTDDPIEAEFLAILARNPSSKRALMGLAGHYAERKNVAGFDEMAQRIYRLSGGRGPNWTHIASIGRQLDPDNPLFALAAGETGEPALPSADEAGVPAAPIPEPDGVAPPFEGPSSTEAAAPAAAELPSEVRSEVPPEVPPEVPSAAVPVPSDAVPFEPQAGHSAGPAEAQAPQPEDAQPVRSELPEPATSPEPETAAAPEREATLPPEAIAALDGLDIGLPPRLGPVTEGPPDLAEAHPEEPEDEEQEKHEGRIPEGAAAVDAHIAPTPSPTDHADHAERTEKAEHPAQAAPAAPEARPAVTGLGAAPVGRLNLSFDLNLPGAQTEGQPEGQTGEGEPSDIAPTPQFTPEQLARIARNKLDLAAEYIALGDLGGARTLIHEVIESNDAATHAEAHAMLATLAPLS